VRFAPATAARENAWHLAGLHRLSLRFTRLAMYDTGKMLLERSFGNGMIDGPSLALASFI